MKTLLLLGCLFFSVMAGYWLMVKLDGFLARGGIRPYWDDQAEESRQREEDWDPEADHVPWGNLHTRRQ